MKLVEESAYSIPELLAIDKYLDSVSTEHTIIHEARAEGRTEGRTEGKAEIARKMKIKNMPICDIVELT